MRKIISVLLCFALLSATCMSLGSCFEEREEPPDPRVKDYENALVLLANCDYAGAKAVFEKLGDYKDSNDYLSGFRYVMTGMTYQAIGETGTVEITLDKNNLPTKISLRSSEINSAYVFVYGDGGRIVRDEMHSGEDESIVTNYTYDANNCIIKSVCSFSDGTQIISEYTNDARGNMLKEVTTIGENVAITDYTYNESGNLLSKVRVGAYGDQSTVRYTYDESGKMLKETHEGLDGYVIDYTYNANGYLVKEVVTEGGESQFTDEYTYDANGNVIKKVSTDAEGNQSVLEAQYALVYIPFTLPKETEDVLKAFLDIV